MLALSAAPTRRASTPRRSSAQTTREPATAHIAAYLRVSRTDQDASIQRSLIEAHVSRTAPDAHVTWYVDEGLSGAKRNRPQLTAALNAVKNGECKTLMVAKLDRLGRDAGHLLELFTMFKAKNVNFVSLAESIDLGTAAGRMFASSLAIFAEFERERISERITDALAVRRNGGRVYGKVRYGWRRDGDRLVIDRDEQKVIAQMREWRDAGVTYRHIATTLNERGIPTHSGKPWYSKTVQQIADRTDNALEEGGK